jgi:hypothetical protein
MSAKSVSKMCIFVHKLVKNAHFSPRKVQKRGFFAGGRGDFLAGQKRGFLGSRESRASGAASCENRSQSLTPAMAASQHFTKVSVNKINFIRQDSMLRMHRGEFYNGLL